MTFLGLVVNIYSSTEFAAKVVSQMEGGMHTLLSVLVSIGGCIDKQKSAQNDVLAVMLQVKAYLAPKVITDCYVITLCSGFGQTIEVRYSPFLYYELLQRLITLIVGFSISTVSASMMIKSHNYNPIHIHGHEIQLVSK